MSRSIEADLLQGQAKKFIHGFNAEHLNLGSGKSYRIAPAAMISYIFRPFERLPRASEFGPELKRGYFGEDSRPEGT